MSSDYATSFRPELKTVEPLLSRGSKVLDVGCGTGANALYLAARGHTVTAVDLNPEALEELGRNPEDSAQTIFTLEGSLPHLPGHLLEGQFDLVLCTMVLHFLPPDVVPQAVANLRRATKPGGYAVITVYVQQPALRDPAYRWLPRSNELPEVFGEWEVVSHHETYPFNLRSVRTLPQMKRWLLGRRGYLAGRLIARTTAE